MRSHLPLLLAAAAAAASLDGRLRLAGPSVCEAIAGQIRGQVYFPQTPGEDYHEALEHYMPSSSAQSACVAEVADPADVAAVMGIVAATWTPFAVKSGGHASNPGFSSTTGVHISLVRFNQVTLSEDKTSVEVGTGLRWTEVYDALDGSGVQVVGGRAPGPGVGGLTLGGGYSWLSDQHGLTCDTVIAYNIVLPNSTITRVDASQPDLFFALKGGLNRFGVVTSIVFHTFPQPHEVYGGIEFYGLDALPELSRATERFQRENTDPKSQLILTINSGLVPGALLVLFHDGPDRPLAFAPFDPIRSTGNLNTTTVQTQSLAAFVRGVPTGNLDGQRGAFHTLMTTSLTEPFLAAIAAESAHYGALAPAHRGTFISYSVEPFLCYGEHATDAAFPHAATPLPLNLYFTWDDPAQDAFWRDAMQRSVDLLIDVARREGIFDDAAPAYPNYAPDTYAGARLYGEANVGRLRAVRATVDPDGVMGLAGGFSF